MFENIGWLLYAYTRLDALNNLLWVFLSAVIIFGFTAFVCWAYNKDMDYEDTANNWIGRGKKSVALAGVLSCLIAVIPTKQNALLIYGVTTGVAVAEKTIEAANNSEIVGKVLQIVEAKIDKELNEVKKENK